MWTNVWQECELPSCTCVQVWTKPTRQTVKRKTCVLLCFMCLHVFLKHGSVFHFQHACMCVYVCVTCLFRSSFDVCCPHMCSLYTAQCSGWSRSERVVPAVVLSAAERPAPSRPCLPSSTPRSSWRSDGCPRGWSRARSVSLACRKRWRSSVNMAVYWPHMSPVSYQTK